MAPQGYNGKTKVEMVILVKLWLRRGDVDVRDPPRLDRYGLSLDGASGLREAGTYALRWDGRDDAGRQMASGVYLYRLEAPAMTGDRIVQTRKLLLLR